MPVKETINQEQLDATLKVLNEKNTSEEEKITAETVIEWVNEADPTERNKYDTFILRQIKYGNVQFPEDIPQVNADLTEFINYINSGNLEEGEGDINSYERVGDLREKLDELQGTDKKSKLQLNTNLPGVKLYRQEKPFKIFEVTNPDSLAKLGNGTRWCTREEYPECQAERYIERYDKIYVITMNGKLIGQYTPDYSETMNVNDQPLFDDDGELNLA